MENTRSLERPPARPPASYYRAITANQNSLSVEPLSALSGLIQHNEPVKGQL